MTIHYGILAMCVIVLIFALVLGSRDGRNFITERRDHSLQIKADSQDPVVNWRLGYAFMCVVVVLIGVGVFYAWRDLSIIGVSIAAYLAPELYRFGHIKLGQNRVLIPEARVPYTWRWI